MKKVAIWCEHAFQLYSAKPVVDKYLAQGCHVVVYTFKENIQNCINYTGLSASDIVNINNLIQKRTSILTYIYELLFVDINYSIVYRERRLRKEKGIYRLLAKCTFFLNVRKENVNSFYLKYARLVTQMGLHKKTNIDCDLLVSFTRIRFPLLVSGIKIPHISIMESWDHPVKDPYFINPNYSLVWNKSLKEDTKFYQKLKNVSKIFPLKFRYIYEREKMDLSDVISSINNQQYVQELISLRDKSIVLYPTTTSSAGIEHDGEMILIDHLCQACQKADRILYIKPKPNGPVGDYDVFKKYTNVIVGLYSSSTDALDMLDEEYHSFRYCLLKMADIIVNAGTTFVLEAALTDKKIIQLDLRSQLFGGFSEYTKTEHLRKYILNSKSEVYDGNVDNLVSMIEDVNYEYCLSIKTWITN